MTLDRRISRARRVVMRRLFKRLVANVDALIWSLGGGAQLRH
ncbi:hypothetical protein [Caulobacter sp. NIBR1757]|nr:hypothetical protein [Caulobacter sp. NIBR1757]